MSIDLPNPVSSIGGRTFYNCESLVSLNLPNSLTSIGNGAFYNCKNLKTLDLPNGLTNIGADAFFQCKNLEITNFPNSLISIGARAFSACDSIREAVFSDKLKYVGNKAFYSCVSLKRVSFYSDSVNVGEGTFEGCYSLSDVVLPVEMDTIRNNLFSGCSSLEEITFPKKLKSVGNKAFYKSGIVSAILPEGTLRIGDYAFQYCSKLKTLFIPSTVTILAEYPFRYCPALESIKVAEGNPIFDSRDDCNALIRKEHTDTYTVNGQEYPGPTIWCGCDNTVIPSSVVSISGGAFCGNMTAVHIPQTVKLICGSAFVACEKLDSVFLYSEEPPHVNIYGGGGFSFPQSISVFVPRGTKDRYKATSWKGYRLIMEWSSSAIDEIEVDDALVDGEEPAEYYNLQGVRVVNPTNGVFIKKQGGKISKIVL